MIISKKILNFEKKYLIRNFINKKLIQKKSLFYCIFMEWNNLISNFWIETRLTINGTEKDFKSYEKLKAITNETFLDFFY